MAKIKRISVLKMAAFSGIFGVFMGIIGAIFGVISQAIFSALLPPEFAGQVGFSMTGFLLLPIIYGVGGFFSGLIFTPLMNLTLKMIKGLDLNIDMVESTPQPAVQTQAA